jgi:hypothetical protein
MRLGGIGLFSVFCLLFTASPALAQKKPKDKDKKSEGPSASATWTDPVDSEKSDKGPFTPKSEAEEQGDAPKPEHKHDSAPDKGRKRDKLQVVGQLIFGFGSAPGTNPAYTPGEKGTALGFMLGGRYDATPALSVGLRLPVSMVMAPQGPPNGGTHKNLTTTVFGAPELLAEYRISLNRLTNIPILFGVGIPVAQGNPDETNLADTGGYAQNYANQLADATSGWRDSELFQPKHLPIVLGGGIHHERQDWELHGDLKFVLMPALSTKLNSAPERDPANPGNYKLNSFALREVTTVGGSYNFLDVPVIFAGLDLAVVWTPISTFVFDAASGGAKPSAVQAVLEPRIGARFGKMSPSIGYIAPLGGRLSEANDGGVRLRVDAFF